ncbi:MAG: Uma2 family endonuclease [Microscillaceae bacterium]|jgi:Uma2 family endonuclease|nr:Uma2 family endonuclease [Microscillaceae bacterium]
MKISETTQYELERHKPIPSKLHSITQTNLLVLITIKYSETYRPFSELSLRLDGWDSVPDIALYLKTEIDFNHDEIQMTEPPLCAIEILSPTQSLQELVYKAEKYFQVGVKSCWLVIPSLKNVYVFADRENYQMYKFGEQLLDEKLNIQLALNEVFK